MTNSKKRKFRFIPKRNAPRLQAGPWCAFVQVGEGEEVFSKEIYFKALSGGEAKSKALPKIQSLLTKVCLSEGGSPFVKVLLACASSKGKKDQAPSYVLRRSYSYYKSIIAARKSSRVFKLNAGHNGGADR